MNFRATNTATSPSTNLTFASTMLDGASDNGFTLFGDNALAYITTNDIFAGASIANYFLYAPDSSTVQSLNYSNVYTDKPVRLYTGYLSNIDLGGGGSLHVVLDLTATNVKGLTANIILDRTDLSKTNNIFYTDTGAIGTGFQKELRGAAAPVAGTWSVGDHVINTAPAVGQPKGWFCTVSGSPGTWISEGNL